MGKEIIGEVFGRLGSLGRNGIYDFGEKNKRSRLAISVPRKGDLGFSGRKIGGAGATRYHGILREEAGETPALPKKD